MLTKYAGKKQIINQVTIHVLFILSKGLEILKSLLENIIELT